MGLKSIILMRHAEREDRALEAEGKDWISTAPRPQDPLLSPKGVLQAKEVGRQLQDRGITRILCSPMIRTVLTADHIAEVLGLGPNSVCVEMGLVEEAKSFRGKTNAEPLPKWTPLILPISELCNFSSRIDTSYESHWHVGFVKDEAALNHVREEHAHLTARDEITRDRCREAAWRIVLSDRFDNETILCVGHGATVGGYHKALEAELPQEMRVSGERTVSCYSEFAPVDPENPRGPWRSVTGTWATGDIFRDGSSADDKGDQG